MNKHFRDYRYVWRQLNCMLSLGFFATLLNIFGLTVLLGDEPKAKNYALLVAVTKYQDAFLNDPPLKYPQVDAEEIAKLLEKSDYKVDRLFGLDATKHAIEEKLNKMADWGSDGGTVVIGFFGHGVEFESTNEAMFIPVDAQRRHAEDAGGKKLFAVNGDPLTEPKPSCLVGMSTVRVALAVTKAKYKLLFADCCRNNPNASRGKRAFGENVKQVDLPMNTAAIFACSKGEFAHESDDWMHGALTKCFLESVGELKGESTDVGAITGRLQKRVTSLVQAASKGRSTQTVHPIINGVVELQLKVAPTSATPEMKQSAVNAKPEQKDFWEGDVHPEIAKKLRSNPVWRKADSMAEIFQCANGEWIAMAVGKHPLDSNFPYDACEMHAHAKYMEHIKGVLVNSKRVLEDAKLKKVIEAQSSGQVMPLSVIAKWESSDGKTVSVLYGEVLKK